MTKRLVLADDVTGEFDGVVDVQLKNTFVAVEGAPADGDAIVWDETTEQWVPAPVEGGSSLTVLSEAEGDAGVATTARAISAERLKQQIEQHGITVIPGNVVRGLIVETGTEVRPAADVVVWIDPDELGAVNALATDPIITPGESGGGGSSASPDFLAATVPPVAYRWVIPPFAENDGHDSTDSGRMCLTRWEFREPVTVTGIATDVFGDPGGSTVIRMGIYDALDATAPVAGSEVTVAAATGGNKVDTSLAVSLAAGVYWVACVAQGASSGVRHFKFPLSFCYWDEAHNALQNLRSWSDGATISHWVNGITGALPSLASSTLLNEQDSPLAVTLRLA